MSGISALLPDPESCAITGPRHNAKVVDRLLASGCVILGKTNLHEFAFGATSVNPHYGPVRNPWDPTRISGGSSGGSAAAVAAGLCVASLGTDTGGSIRIPAAACGCVGLKPTHGLVPLDGVIPLAPSLDHVGPITRCVEDAATILEAISRDWTEAGKGRWKMPRGLRQGAAGLRIGIPKQYFFDRVRPDVRRAVLTAISRFQDAGAKLVEVDLPGMKETGELAAEITVAEALAYHWKWLQTRAGDYGDDLRTRMMEKLEMPAVAYIRYLERRQAYAERLARAIDACDVIAGPTLPMPAGMLHSGHRGRSRAISGDGSKRAAETDQACEPGRVACDLHSLWLFLGRSACRPTVDRSALRGVDAATGGMVLRTFHSLAYEIPPYSEF